MNKPKMDINRFDVELLKEKILDKDFLVSKSHEAIQKAQEIYKFIEVFRSQRLLQMCHYVFGTIYLIAGVPQLAIGLLLLLGVPYLERGSNIWTGGVGIFIGLITLILAGTTILTMAKTRTILLLAGLLLFVDFSNLIVLEFGEWKHFKNKDTAMLQELVDKFGGGGISLTGKSLYIYLRIGLSAASGFIILMCLVHSIVSFCSLEFYKVVRVPSQREIADVDSIFVKKKSPTRDERDSDFRPVPPIFGCDQSWVFDSDSVPASGITRTFPVPAIKGIEPLYLTYSKGAEDEEHYPSSVIQIRADETPPEPLYSDDRQLHHMKSFSRTPSPAEISNSSSAISIPPPIYECLERLSQPPLYRSRLDSYRITRDASAQTSMRAIKSSRDNENYATLVKELRKSLNRKGDRTLRSRYPTSSSSGYTSSYYATCGSTMIDATGITNGTATTDTTTDTTTTETTTGTTTEMTTESMENRQAVGDAEFSKELEAALKLIQDLESPKTIETPSESYKVIGDDSTARDAEFTSFKRDSDTSNTSSGNSSSFEVNGKISKSLQVESQSTSGYNSPSLDRSSRLTPTMGVSCSDLTGSQESSLSCLIRHLGDTAVISLFSPLSKPHPYSGEISGPSEEPEKPEVVTRENNYENEPGKSAEERNTKNLAGFKMKSIADEEKYAKAKLRRWRQFIERRRRPSLLPEVESAIMKSECLAFLTKSELLERLNQTKTIHRQIEAKVVRQRSLRKADSFGSVEDIIERYGITTFL